MKYKPISAKDLYLKPVSLKVDGHIIIDAINNNDFEWLIDKAIESYIALSNGLYKNRRHLLSNGEIAKLIGDAVIQIEIISHLFGTENVQKYINQYLIGIGNRTIKLNTKRSVGFKIENKPEGDT